MSGIQTHATVIDANQMALGQDMRHQPHLAWPNDTWWHAYGDSQLDDLMQAALAGSPTLKVAQARLSLAQAFAEGRRAETQPTLSTDVSLSRQRFSALQFIPPPWAGNYDWYNSATVSLAYDLDLWGRQESLWKGTVDEALATAAETQQVKLALETAVVRHYLRLSLEFTLLDIARCHEADVAERVAIARRALATGIGTEMEVNQAELPLPLARAQVLDTETRIAQERNQLAALSGNGPGAGDHILRPKLALAPLIGLPDQLPANLVGRRPDVVAQRWRVESAREFIDSAKAAFYPNINLLGFVGFQALGFGQFLSNGAAVSGIGPALSLPLFDGGRRRSNLTASSAAYDMAVENYNATLLGALQDVSDQLLMLQSQVKQLDEANQALQFAQKYSMQAQARYEHGLTDYSHVLDARDSLLRQQAAVATMEAARMDAHAALMRALGGGV